MAKKICDLYVISYSRRSDLPPLSSIHVRNSLVLLAKAKYNRRRATHGKIRTSVIDFDVEKERGCIVVVNGRWMTVFELYPEWIDQVLARQTEFFS